MGLLTAATVKNLNFQNPRWQTAAIVKTVKSPYVRNRLTDFDEIWHDDANCPPTGDRALKFRIFKNPRWRRPPFLKNHKNRDISAMARQIRTKFDKVTQNGLLTGPTVKKFEFPKSKMADGRQCENS